MEYSVTVSCDSDDNFEAKVYTDSSYDYVFESTSCKVKSDNNACSRTGIRHRSSVRATLEWICSCMSTSTPLSSDFFCDLSGVSIDDIKKLIHLVGAFIAVRAKYPNSGGPCRIARTNECFSVDTQSLFNYRNHFHGLTFQH